MIHSSRRQLWHSLVGLPHWVKLWLIILMGVNMSSLWFIDSDIGRWTLITFLVIGMFNLPMAYFQNGLTRLLSFPHLLWFGLLAYLGVQLWGQEALQIGALRNYAIAVFLINTISLGFDTVECIRWMQGEREVLGLKPLRKDKIENSGDRGK